MLPSILPLGAVPVTSGQDPVRPRPDIPPVVPAQASSSESAIDLKHSDADQATLLLREEQRRQQEQRRRESREQGSTLPQVVDEVPVEPLADGMQRQGVWVDIKV
ncbi:aspartate-semialdehyde dehydrogenase [Pseudomonas sp. FSL R10-0056]|uniref:Aspartate-semialdehyde dehydrogenase n=3 Tax=Pseudomonas TaxID=286 RepID=A0A266ZX01_PSEFR|nr:MULTISPECIES: aspartate-semialdehyde dehydrogenase [Pseudomonas]MBO4966582.1 aspartate-semialdehyde dehydrogenase [Pseudomonas sp.]MBO6279424.1 aspartate-semialdehyde dehydrogenase [Pseudomonas sp.]MBP3859255.1 aspartate-semialdehyde dehydrogenase [Pseudomonas sp.]MBP3865751.1 aspartate-semialdehyde dehydrogenase [Pseudomonas sp.]MCH4883539.1 aspartate-semialdehyde dehydrogenase [Pseudomonas sp. TMW22080]